MLASEAESLLEPVFPPDRAPRNALSAKEPCFLSSTVGFGIGPGDGLGTGTDLYCGIIEVAGVSIALCTGLV